MLKRILSLLLTFPLLLGLAACAPTDPGPSGTSGTTTGNGDSGTPPAPSDTVFGAGGTVEGAGDKLAAGCFALTEHPVDAAAAESGSATSIRRKLLAGSLEAGRVYAIDSNEPMVFEGINAKTCEGNGAVLLAPGGVVLDGCTGMVLKNLTVVGPVTVRNSETVTIERVDFQGGATAVTVDASSADVLLNECRIVASEVGIQTAGTDTGVLASYVAAATGVADTGKGTVIHGCRLVTSGGGIVSSGSDFAARENTLEPGSEAIGIELQSGVYCSLVALNVIKSTQRSVTVNEGYNTVVILNSAIRVQVKNSVSSYICDNALGGRVEVEGNNYLLADGNTYPSDGKAHAALSDRNENVNGDTLTDVEHRAEVGADESLLPHTNKDLFVGMERKDTVRDVTLDREYSINDYIKNRATTDERVIVAPGAYANHATLELFADQKNTTVYAYGVYMERQTDLYKLLALSNTENVTLKGITMGYKQQSCGQVYVLEKMGGGKVKVITGAGMMNDFATSSTTYFNTDRIGAQKADTFYAWCDAILISVEKNSDGTMTIGLPQNLYQAIDPGEVLTCRAANGGNACSVHYSSNVNFKDIVLYGSAAGLAFFESYNYSTVSYYRWHNTSRSGELIDEETYNRYRALEEEYGVSLEVYVDEEGRFRGSPAHIGSIDATHVDCCYEGSTIVSCLFENMCDDGTNQRAIHARLASVTDNGNGTTTLTYKGNWCENNWRSGSSTLGYCAPFRVGDRVFVYNSAGRLVCDTPALTASEKVGTANHTYTGVKYDLMTVTVDTDAVNLDAIDGFDLSDDNYLAGNKVLVDNMDRSSNGFHFDNTVVQNIRSRGLLIKSSNGVVKNCTFRNVGMGGVAVLYEIFWGESGVTENMLIEKNLFDHTGFFDPTQDHYSCISIEGLGSSVKEDYLLYKNITIQGNKVINRASRYAVYINSARDVKVLDNDFGLLESDSFAQPTRDIHINGAMNVEISGNSYSPHLEEPHRSVVAERHKNIFGSDVSDEDGNLLIPDAIS